MDLFTAFVDRVSSLVSELGFGQTGWGFYLLGGAAMTLAVTVFAMIIGAIVGALVTWAKLADNVPAKIVGNIYTVVLRGAPELLIIYMVYFGKVVDLIGNTVSALGLGDSHVINSFLAGALGVGLISAAYQAEVFRGAYTAIFKGEIEAARSIGMHRFMRFRRIIAPQIMRYAIPGLGNVFQLSIKDSALISVTGLVEIMNASNKAAGSTKQFFMFFIVGACLYLVLTSISTRMFNAGERRVAKTFRRPVGM
ncbi:ABC transporter permease subunit [Methylovirgula sp. 4M-Z18]|uniref:ABC transporter permease n=2 Tax=Methylovirgula sp. 4M-Z18 TaxID=2293567 RepID=UPI0024793FA2|nr:ABC transporter permease subunit [Methylovirgula sp. 4M-Z18]